MDERMEEEGSFGFVSSDFLKYFLTVVDCFEQTLTRI